MQRTINRLAKSHGRHQPISSRLLASTTTTTTLSSLLQCTHQNHFVPTTTTLFQCTIRHQSSSPSSPAIRFFPASSSSINHHSNNNNKKKDNNWMIQPLISTTTKNKNTKTVVCLFGWLGAQWNHLSKYAQWYNDCQLDCLAIIPPMTCLLNEKQAVHYAQLYMDQLLSHTSTHNNDNTNNNNNNINSNNSNSNGQVGEEEEETTGVVVVQLIVHVLSGNGLYMYGHLMENPSFQQYLSISSSSSPPQSSSLSSSLSSLQHANNNDNNNNNNNSSSRNSEKSQKIRMDMRALIADSTPPLISSERFTDGFMYALFPNLMMKQEQQSTTTTTSTTTSITAIITATITAAITRMIRSLVSSCFHYYLNQPIVFTTHSFSSLSNTTSTTTTTTTSTTTPITMTRKQYIEKLRDHLIHIQPICNQLYIYSDSDRVVPAEEVEIFIARIRQEQQQRVLQGRDRAALGENKSQPEPLIETLKFHQSDHVAHLRSHPYEYTSHLHKFIQQSLLLHNDTRLPTSSPSSSSINK